MLSMIDSQSASSRPFLIATMLSAGGSAIGLLGATAALTLANAVPGSGGLATSIYLAIVAIAAPFGLSQSPHLAHSIGTRRLFILGKVATGLVWLLAGALLLFGLPPAPVLYSLAPVMGWLLGALGPITPSVNRAYLAPGQGMAKSVARAKVWSGLGAMFGAGLGGLLLSIGVFAWGLILNAALSVPLVLVTLLSAPRVEIPEPRASNGIWHELRTSVRSNRRLRLVIFQGCLTMLLIAPMTSLVVPIARSLRHEPLVAGSGLLLAAISAGALMTVQVTGRLSRHRTDLEAAVLSGAVAALVLVVLAVSGLMTAARPELAVWAIAGVGFGMFRYSARALTVGATADAVPPGQQTQGLAVVGLVSTLVAPVGLLLWGLLLDFLGAEWTLAITGMLAVATAGLLLGTVRREGRVD